MASNENDAESLVRDFLVQHGFEVERIAASQTAKRADYRARHGSETYLVEVKGRPGDDAYGSDLFTKGYAESQSPLGRINTVSSIVRRAARQLDSTEAEDEPFRILALVAEGDDTDTQLTQLKSSLYGIVGVCVPGESNTAEEIPCFYFIHSDFVRFPDVDAAILFGPGACLLCVNELSSRVHSFRSSELYRLYESHGAVIDPPDQERQGRAFIADLEADRSSEEATVRFIKRKYSLPAAIAVNPKKVRIGVMRNLSTPMRHSLV
jgi:hypothetical protein